MVRPDRRFDPVTPSVLHAVKGLITSHLKVFLQRIRHTTQRFVYQICVCFFLLFEKCNQSKGVAKRTVRHQSVGRSRKENLSAFNCRNPTRQSRSFLMTRPTPSRAYPLWRPIKNSRVSKLNKFNSGSVKCRRSVA